MAMDRQTKNIVTILGVVLVVGIMTGYISIPGVTLAVAAPAEPGAVVTDGVTVYTGTPTVAWFATDAMLNTPVTPANYRVTINGVPQEYEQDDTTSASFGDSYTVCLLPNTTYYGKCVTGTISKVTEKINIVTYHLASQPTMWVNNDPENSTTRNSAAAPDNIGDDEDMQATVCVSGNGAAQAFGPDGLAFVVDWNNLMYDAIYFSEGTLTNVAIPSHILDANSTATAVWEVPGPLLNGQTICGTMTVDGETTATDAETFSSGGGITITTMDKFLSRHSATDALETMYKRNLDGADTNSCTDGSVVYQLTS